MGNPVLNEKGSFTTTHIWLVLCIFWRPARLREVRPHVNKQVKRSLALFVQFVELAFFTIQREGIRLVLTRMYGHRPLGTVPYKVQSDKL